MKRFGKLVSLSIQGALYYRAAFLLNLFIPAAVLGGQFMLWSSLFRIQEGAVIGGYTRESMYAYLIIAFFVNNLLTWSSENNLSREIRSGMVAARCIRPLPFLTQSLASMTGAILPQALVNGVVAVLLFVLLSSWVTVPSLAALPAGLACLVLGVLLRMMFTSWFSLLCFYTTSHLGLSWTRTAVVNFFSGALIPVSMFPAWLKTVSYVTPFPLMLQTPISVLLGQSLPLPLPWLCAAQTGWILCFYGLHQIFYGRIRRNLTIAGG